MMTNEWQMESLQVVPTLKLFSPQLWGFHFYPHNHRPIRRTTMLRADFVLIFTFIHVRLHLSFIWMIHLFFYTLNFSRTFFHFLLKDHCFCATESNFNFQCFICLTSLPQYVVKRLYVYGTAPRMAVNQIKKSFTLLQ